MCSAFSLHIHCSLKLNFRLVHSAIASSVPPHHYCTSFQGEGLLSTMYRQSRRRKCMHSRRPRPHLIIKGVFRALAPLHSINIHSANGEQSWAPFAHSLITKHAACLLPYCCLSPFTYALCTLGQVLSLGRAMRRRSQVYTGIGSYRIRWRIRHFYRS